MRTITIILIAISSWVFVGSDLIVWSADQKLVWSDFKSQTRPVVGHDAYTRYEISASGQSISQSRMRYEVTCSFNCKRSWVAKGSRDSVELLAHEQLHFDIGECSARALRSVMARPTSASELSDKLSLAHDSITQVYDAMQDSYDLETKHGILEQEQVDWQDR